MSSLPMIIFTLHRTWTSNSKLARDFTLSEGFSFGPFQSRERKNIERSSRLSLIPHFSTIPHHPSSSSTIFLKLLINHHSSSSPFRVYISISLPAFHGIFLRFSGVGRSFGQSFRSRCHCFLLGSRGYPLNDV